MSGTNWDDEQAANLEPTPGDQSGGGAQQPETVAFGPDGGVGNQPRRHSRRRLIASASSVAAVVVIAVVVVLVTVGSGQTPAQAVASAVRQSGGYHSVSAHISEQVSGASSASITGKVTVQRTPLRMSMNISEDLSGENIPIAAILTGNAMYLKLGVSAGLPANAAGKWIELRFAQLGSLASLGSLLHNLQSENPVSQVQALAGAKHVHAAGNQVVSGVQTTKYTGSFSPSAAIKLLPKSVRSALSPVLKQVTGNIKFSIWIGGGKVWQLREVEHVLSSKVTVTIHYLSYNQPVHISIPSGSNVYQPSASQLSGGL